eukprot:scaffold47102_cov22-Prasinocladus_malaysianus.AAC.1
MPFLAYASAFLRWRSTGPHGYWGCVECTVSKCRFLGATLLTSAATMKNEQNYLIMLHYHST